jgi:NAD(P)-dependent dehydrogenase (short-subunit alcohol dehydrogenase family)
MAGWTFSSTPQCRSAQVFLKTPILTNGSASSRSTRMGLALALACRPHLKKSPAPAIVHVASLAGTHGYANSGPYGPSKAALITLSWQMALEWAVDNIRGNVVIPGTIMTPAVSHATSPRSRWRRGPNRFRSVDCHSPSELADVPFATG